MSDPIEAAIREIANSPLVRESKKLSSSFLNNVADVFEIYGFAVTKLYLQDRIGRGRESENQARILLAALNCLEKVEMVRRHRAIGRLIIKNLRQIVKE